VDEKKCYENGEDEGEAKEVKMFKIFHPCYTSLHSTRFLTPTHRISRIFSLSFDAIQTIKNIS
jgi:hypothetical protein